MCVRMCLRVYVSSLFSASLQTSKHRCMGNRPTCSLNVSSTFATLARSHPNSSIRWSMQTTPNHHGLEYTQHRHEAVVSHLPNLPAVCLRPDRISRMELHRAVRWGNSQDANIASSSRSAAKLVPMCAFLCTRIGTIVFLLKQHIHIRRLGVIRPVRILNRMRTMLFRALYTAESPHKPRPTTGVEPPMPMSLAHSFVVWSSSVAWCCAPCAHGPSLIMSSRSSCRSAIFIDWAFEAFVSSSHSTTSTSYNGGRSAAFFIWRTMSLDMFPLNFPNLPARRHAFDSALLPLLNRWTPVPANFPLTNNFRTSWYALSSGFFAAARARAIRCLIPPVMNACVLALQHVCQYI